MTELSRPGAMRGGVSDVKQHRFFEGLNWAEVEMRKFSAGSLKPNLAGPVTPHHRPPYIHPIILQPSPALHTPNHTTITKITLVSRTGLPVRTCRLRGICAKLRGRVYQNKSARVEPNGGHGAHGMSDSWPCPGGAG